MKEKSISKNLQEENEVASCPFCRKTGEKLLFSLQDQEGEKDVYRCLGCRLIYAKGGFDFNRLLANNSLPSKRGFEKVFSARREKLVLAFLLKNIEPGFVLQPECGAGKILSALKKNGYRTIGLNSDMGLYENSKLDDDIYEANFLDFWHYDNEFDALLLIDILNYSKDPYSYLKKAADFVKIGGHILIEERIFLSRLSQRFGSNYAEYDLSKSVYFFNPKTIKRLFKEMGFREKKIKKCYSIGFSSFLKSFWRMLGKKKITKNLLAKLIVFLPVLALSPLINLYYFLSNLKRYNVFGNRYLAVYQKIK